MTYIIQSKNFTQEFIHEEIENALTKLYITNQMVFDYWLSELYQDDDGEVKQLDKWNENTLVQLYDDVDSNSR